MLALRRGPDGQSCLGGPDLHRRERLRRCAVLAARHHHNPTCPALELWIRESHPRTAAEAFECPELTASQQYSPGLICPFGYQSACMGLGDALDQSSISLIASSLSLAPAANSTFQFQWPPTASETAVGCCPTYVSRPSTTA